MKVLIEIPREHYDPRLAGCDRGSPEYNILKNSVVAYDREAKTGRRTVQIFCDEELALKLLDAANLIYPEVTHAISTAINRARREE
jgi:hypothetical protein